MLVGSQIDGVRARCARRHDFAREYDQCRPENLRPAEFADYRQDGNLLVPGPVMGTKMACPDMTLESDFQTVLTQIDVYVAGETTLTFTDLDGSAYAKFELGAPK